MSKEAVSMSGQAHSPLAVADASAPNWLTPQCTHTQSLRANTEVGCAHYSHKMTKKQGTFEIRITTGGGRCNA